MSYRYSTTINFEAEGGLQAMTFHKCLAAYAQYLAAGGSCACGKWFDGVTVNVADEPLHVHVCTPNRCS